MHQHPTALDKVEDGSGGVVGVHVETKISWTKELHCYRVGTQSV